MLSVTEITVLNSHKLLRFKHDINDSTHLNTLCDTDLSVTWVKLVLKWHHQLSKLVCDCLESDKDPSCPLYCFLLWLVVLEQCQTKWCKEQHQCNVAFTVAVADFTRWPHNFSCDGHWDREGEMFINQIIWLIWETVVLIFFKMEKLKKIWAETLTVYYSFWKLSALNRDV